MSDDMLLLCEGAAKLDHADSRKHLLCYERAQGHVGKPVTYLELVKDGRRRFQRESNLLHNFW